MGNVLHDPARARSGVRSRRSEGPVKLAKATGALARNARFSARADAAPLSRSAAEGHKRAGHLQRRTVRACRRCAAGT
jgi:hypothetical protein